MPHFFSLNIVFVGVPFGWKLRTLKYFIFVYYRSNPSLSSFRIKVQSIPNLI